MWRFGRRRNSRHDLLYHLPKSSTLQVMNSRIRLHRTRFWGSYLQSSLACFLIRSWSKPHRPILYWNQEAIFPNADSPGSFHSSRQWRQRPRIFSTRNYSRARTNSCVSIAMEPQPCTMEIDRWSWFCVEAFARRPTASRGSWWRGATSHSCWVESPSDKLWYESLKRPRNSRGPLKRNPSSSTRLHLQMPFRKSSNYSYPALHSKEWPIKPIHLQCK